MELQEIADCIATTESALLSGFASHIDFRVGETICRVARSENGIRYSYRSSISQPVASAAELAAIAYHAQPTGIAKTIKAKNRRRTLREKRDVLEMSPHANIRSS